MNKKFNISRATGMDAYGIIKGAASLDNKSLPSIFKDFKEKSICRTKI